MTNYALSKKKWKNQKIKSRILGGKGAEKKFGTGAG